MSGKHRKTTAVVKNPVQMAPRHKDTSVEQDAPSRAGMYAGITLSLDDLMRPIAVGNPFSRGRSL
jgi:hypothetical protein